ncbi:MAG: hypothetical protein HOO00_01980 [Rhodospirillaceae bacterium]|nr:hypothetical protein [Rhodospirillaceae bacterium]MBT5374799.1 hypothetical protein [Rhodospirillaceae bacterium]MBT5658976.1 hypothetical protein [Rhodospirillaceae bacterium]MBT5751618.1 hypothetical protein [Rhodospirillaceae bacterium]
MTKNVAFEIEVYKAGSWKVDSIFDDRALVLFEAKRLESYSRQNNIRVIEETYDDATNQTSARVIFRSAKVSPPATPAPAERKPDVRPNRERQKPDAAKDSGIGQAIWFALAVIAIISAIIFLKSFAAQL